MKNCNINSKLEHKKSQELKETLDSNNNKMEGKHFCYVYGKKEHFVQNYQNQKMKPKRIESLNLRKEVVNNVGDNCKRCKN